MSYTNVDHKGAKRRLLAALRGGDAVEMRTLLASDLWLREHIDEPWGYFDAPAIVEASERGDADMMRVLAAAGADVNARSGWEPGGSGVLDSEHIELWVSEWSNDGTPVFDRPLRGVSAAGSDR